MRKMKYKVTFNFYLSILIKTGVLLQVQFASNDIKQRSPTSVAEKGFVFGSGKQMIRWGEA